MNQLHDFKTLLLHYYTWKLYVNDFINMCLKFSEDLKSVFFRLSSWYHKVFLHRLWIIASIRQATAAVCTQKQLHRDSRFYRFTIWFRISPEINWPKSRSKWTILFYTVLGSRCGGPKDRLYSWATELKYWPSGLRPIGSEIHI